MLEAYKDFWKRYAEFTGVSKRSQFWYSYLINVIIGFILGLLAKDIPFLAGLFSLAILVPSLASGIRRLHDTDRSGWNLLFALIPIVGVIIVIVFWAQPSKSSQYK